MSLLKVTVEGVFQLFNFRGNKMIVSKVPVGMSNGIVSECVFEERDGHVVKDEVGEFVGRERCVRG